jgi:5-methylcytosine-specific restriction endonuclease McrA
LPTRPPIHRPIGWSPAPKRTPGKLAGSKLYDRRWEKVRRMVLNRDPICRCGCGYASEVVDHIVPHNGSNRDPRFYDLDNLQGLTAKCHNAKTRRENRWGSIP